MTYNIAITLSPDQEEFLKRHVSNLETREPGTDPGTTIIRKTYSAGLPAFLQDMFYASISHLIPMPTTGRHAQLQRAAELAIKQARDAKLQSVNVTVASDPASSTSAPAQPAADPGATVA